MKIRLYFIALSCYSLLMGCSNENVVQTSLEVKVESNLKEVDLEIARPLYSISVPEISDPLVLGDSSQHTAVPAPTPSLVGWDTIQYGLKVGMYRELLALFDPDNFDCGCEEKLKRKLRKIRPSNKPESESGFIPRDVLNNALHADTVVLFNRTGSNYLAHSFQYISTSGQKSKMIFADNSPTIADFNETNFIDMTAGVHDNFLYTLDCSGFLSAALAVTAGIDKNSVKASAEGASKIDRSLLVIGGVMYSPLYQAYTGTGVYSAENPDTITKRRKALEAILKAIPEQDHQDDVKVLLNSNYRIVLASNTGSSGFNGKANLGGNGGFRILVASVDYRGESEGRIDRTSSFTNYKTYLTDVNVGSVPSNITVRSIREKINLLASQIQNAG